MSAFDQFYMDMIEYGFEQHNKFYGLYEADVSDNADPEKRGRIKVIVPQIDPDTPIDDWFLPSFMQTGKSYGWFWPPEIGDRVLVSFRLGNPKYPAFYFGAWIASGEVAPLLSYKDGDNTPPYRRGFTTKNGHSFVINDEPDKQEIDLIWKKGDTTSTLKLLPNGSIEVKNKNQSQVLIDAENKKIVIEDKDNSNVITLDSNGVKVETKGKVEVTGATDFIVDAKAIKLGGSGASKSAMLGQDVIDWLNKHTHPTGVGPSGPPTAPATPSLLSNVVKLK